MAGADLFVADGDGASVTELNILTGVPVRVISGSAYQFASPAAMALSGGDLFVANAGASVTVFPS